MNHLTSRYLFRQFPPKVMFCYKIVFHFSTCHVRISAKCTNSFFVVFSGQYDSIICCHCQFTNIFYFTCHCLCHEPIYFADKDNAKAISLLIYTQQNQHQKMHQPNNTDMSHDHLQWVMNSYQHIRLSVMNKQHNYY